MMYNTDSHFEKQNIDIGKVIDFSLQGKIT